MRLHSDENTRCASQWSSLVSLLMLLSWFLPSSVVKKNPTSTCLFGQFRKMNSLAFLSIASSRPQADLHLYCSCWVQCIDKYETFLPPEFQHLELQTQEHPAHLGFSKVSQTTTPNHSGSPPAISACSNAFLLSQLRLCCQHPTLGRAGGNIRSQAVSGPASCSVLAASQRKTG